MISKKCQKLPIPIGIKVEDKTTLQLPGYWIGIMPEKHMIFVNKHGINVIPFPQVLKVKTMSSIESGDGTPGQVFGDCKNVIEVLNYPLSGVDVSSQSYKDKSSLI